MRAARSQQPRRLCLGRRCRGAWGAVQSIAVNARASATKHARCCHATAAPGTGCIFHYDDNFPEGSGKGFKEADTPNFTGSYYSYTKARGSLGAWATACMPRQLSAPAWCACKPPAPKLRAPLFPPACCRAQAMVESLLKEFPNVLTLRVRMPIVQDLLYPRNFITKVRRRRRRALHESAANLCNALTVQALPYSRSSSTRR